MCTFELFKLNSKLNRSVVNELLPNPQVNTQTHTQTQSHRSVVITLQTNRLNMNTKKMDMNMDHGSHTQMTVECKTLGCPKKTIDDRISKVIQEYIACLHKGPVFTKG